MRAPSRGTARSKTGTPSLWRKGAVRRTATTTSSSLGRILPDVRGWRPTFRQQVLSEFGGRKFLVLIGIYGFAAIAGAYGASSGSPDRWEPSDPSVDLFILSSLTTFFAALLGVAVSFDTFFRERVNGTFETMLVHPVSREGIFLGKTLAQFVPYYLVMALLNDIGVLVIARNVGYPGPVQIAAFVLLAPLVMLVFVLLLNGLSFARPTSRSLVVGLALWLFFSPFVWTLLPASLGYALGYEVTEESTSDIKSDYSVFANRVDMTNPIFAAIGMVSMTGEEDADDYVEGVPRAAPFLSMALWLLLSAAAGVRWVRSCGVNRPKRDHPFRLLPHIGQ